MRIMSQILCGVSLLSTLAGAVQAFGLGELHSRTELGQPLDAYIDLYIGPKERQAPLTVSLAHDIFADPAGMQRQAIGAIRATLEYHPGGYALIRLRSEAQMLSPLAFRVRAELAGHAQLKHYKIVPQAVTAKRPSTRVVTRVPPTKPNALLSDIPANSARYGPVRAGETLWSIANQVAGNESVHARMDRIHAANPTAFINGDINRLKLGATLLLPANDVPAADAKSQRSAANVSQPQKMSATKDLPRTDPAPDPLRESVRVNEAKPASYIPRGRDPVVSAQLAELDAKYAAIRAKYAPTKTSRAPIISKPRPIVPSRLDRVDDTPSESAPSVATAPAAIQKSTAVVPSQNNASNTLPVVVLACAIAIGVLVAFRRRKSVKALKFSEDAAQKSAVAEKIAVRMRLEAELQANIAAQRRVVNAPSTNHASNPPSAPIAASSAPVAVLDTDREIDTNIAYGRYQEAERLLQDAIAQTPQNMSAKMRLAEVYYLTERVADFSALAMDLQQHHRADLSTEEWQRLQRMGKIIAPELPLFGGLRLVKKSA
jgi:pilus assembly protein FimV